MATLVRWEPFREFAALQNEMSRLVNSWAGGEGDGDGGTRSWVPSVDVWETDSDVVYAFDLPGIPEDKISVEVEEGSLTVTGERERTEKTEGDRFYRYERRFGNFERSIGLPQGVKEDEIKADYKDGVLEIRVPKPEQAKPRRIQIGDGEQATIEGSKA
jgi:HSP20 family protein